MKHVEGIFGWYEKIWLYERDFYKFFFHQPVLKDWKCERAFVDTMMNYVIYGLAARNWLSVRHLANLRNSLWRYHSQTLLIRSILFFPEVV